MTRRHFVIDTSYLLELYELPGRSDEHAVAAVRGRFANALERRDRLYLPVVSVFELGNHIAQITDGRRRRELALRLKSDVQSGVEHALPWVIVPHLDPEALLNVVDEFASGRAEQQVSLTDTSILAEASRLKNERGPYGEQVHLWTRDTNLKACEPDDEPDAFV